MSIESSQSSVTYVGTGTGTVFPIPMRVDSKADLAVTLLDPAGEISRLEEGRDYRVESVVTDYSEPEPKEIVLTTPLRADWHLTIRRVVPLTQEHTLGNQGAIFPKTMERSLDKLTMIAQQLDRDNQETRQRVTLAEEDLDSLLDRTAGLDSRLDMTEGDVAGLKGDATALKSSVGGLTGTVDSLGSSVSSLAGSVTTVSTRMDGLAGTVGGLDRTVADLSGTVQRVAGEAQSAGDAVGLVTTRVDGIDGRVRDLEEREWDDGGLGEEMTARLGTVETRVGDLDSRAGALETTAESVLARAEDLEERATRLETATGSLQGASDSLESRTTALLTTTGDHASSIETLETGTAALKTASESHDRKILRLEERTQEVETKTSSLTLRVLELESGGGGTDPDDPGSGVGSAVIQEIDTRLGAVEGALTGIRTDLEDVDGRHQASITTLTNNKANVGAVTDLTNRVVVLETAESSLADRFAAKADAGTVTALTTRVGDVADDVDAIGTRVGTVESDATALAGRVGAVETTAGSAATAVGNLQSATGTLTSRIENAESAAVTLSGRVDKKADASVVTSLTGRVGNVEILAGSLDTRTQSLVERTGTLESRADTLTTSLSAKAATSTVTALTGRVGNLETTTGTLSTTLRNKADSATVVAIEERVTELEASSGGGGGGSTGGGDDGSSRILATKDMKFFLHASGNDANSGLTATKVIKTITRLQELLHSYDFNGYAVTVTFATGVYPQTLVLHPNNTLNAKSVTIMNTTSSLPTIGSGMEKGIVVNNVIAPGGVILVSMIFDNNTIGLHVLNSRVTATGILDFRKVSGQCILVERGDVSLTGTPTLSDATLNGKTYIRATGKSVVVDSSATKLTGTPAVAKFYEAVNGSFIDASGFSYTGSGTIGTQFTVGPGSNIWTNGRRSTHFPASSSSVSTNGGGVLYLKKISQENCETGKEKNYGSAANRHGSGELLLHHQIGFKRDQCVHRHPDCPGGTKRTGSRRGVGRGQTAPKRSRPRRPPGAGRPGQ
ncbi:MAG: hypothetical protein LIQ31_07150 [Planctomycetes bacterium]|nr:hypothetical protein [Planctomycetota bacterium]